uniref:Alpha-mannosidase n=1 Tax=Timema monikensis TaxID=170555 RepID=A0A7R9HNX3_9NEOP|nr:unnamed protein product [Timema monikensis]
MVWATLASCIFRHRNGEHIGLQDSNPSGAPTQILGSALYEGRSRDSDMWICGAVNVFLLLLGWQACTAAVPGMLNVHLVPHSHDDVGWLKTVDQYYYGSLSRWRQHSSGSGGCRNDKYSLFRFIQVETAFFWKWWDEQDEDTRDLYKSLVNSGQIEMAGGGWSMNDEAASHYHSTIENFALGLRRLNDTFGSCGRPHVGWQIDPFGHSRETTSIMAQMGFDGLFFSRLDYDDKTNRINTRTMEQVWEASANLGSSADLFTGVLYNHYSYPPGFCFDINCGDDPFIDNKRSPDYNVDEKVQQFISFVNNQLKAYTTQNIILTMGEDFNYQNAHMNFKNMDKLIGYVNALQANGSNINVFYSTPSCYLKALHDANQTWSVKEDDFFPYASEPYSYWTGYFTSRPTQKRLERMGNNLLQVSKQLVVLGNVTDDDSQAKIVGMMEAMGIMQHHDAITGTEKQAVADDYVRILSEGISGCGDVTRMAINNLLSDSNEASNLELKSCLLLNISLCEETESYKDFLVTIYNPISHVVSQYVRLPVSGDSYTVTDYNDEEILSQLVPIPDSILNIAYRNSSARNEIVFQASNLPPLGLTTYRVTLVANKLQGRLSQDLEESEGSNEDDYSDDSFEETDGNDQSLEEDNNDGGEELEKVEAEGDITIGNDLISVSIDGSNGRVKSITNNGIEIPVQQEFLYYEGVQGNNAEVLNRSSGAYIFRPISSEPISISETVSTSVHKGVLVEEVHQVFNDWVSQVIRVYKGETHVEDNVSKEPITRFTTNLESEELFYTDSNGRELLERRRDYRPTWTANLTEPVSGNYYPVTSKILIRDQNKGLELAVLNDRSQGGSSMKDGQVEIMVHRRLLSDDAKGAGEALNETAYGEGLIARGRHFVFAGEIAGSDNVSLAAQERLLAQRILLAPWVFISRGSSAQTRSINKKQFVGLTNSLPENVQVLTLERWTDNSLLLRLEHILEKDEDEVLSRDVSINIQDLLSSVMVNSLRETTLDGNQWLSDTDRFTWTSTDTRHRSEVSRDIQDFSITLTVGLNVTSALANYATEAGYYNFACTGSVPGMLNVHLIPHSHDDVGWLKTVDQYYYGSKKLTNN